MKAYLPVPDTIEYKVLKEMCKQMVKGCGGDPEDNRQRIDHLRSGKPKYW